MSFLLTIKSLTTYLRSMHTQQQQTTKYSAVIVVIYATLCHIVRWQSINGWNNFFKELKSYLFNTSILLGIRKWCIFYFKNDYNKIKCNFFKKPILFRFPKLVNASFLETLFSFQFERARFQKEISKNCGLGVFKKWEYIRAYIRKAPFSKCSR